MRLSKYGNKGQVLEEFLRWANIHYENNGIALVQKIATPVKITRNAQGRVTGAFPEGKSTVDYRGSLKGGQAISFEAKETDELKGIPLINFEEHQVEFLRKAVAMGEIAFAIVWMKKHDKFFVVPAPTLFDRYERWKQNRGRKGFGKILIDEMLIIDSGKGIKVDYLQHIENLKKLK